MVVPPPEGVPVPDKGGDGGGELPAWSLKGPDGWFSLPVTGPGEDPCWVTSPLFAMVATKMANNVNAEDKDFKDPEWVNQVVILESDKLG